MVTFDLNPLVILFPLVKPPDKTRDLTGTDLFCTEWPTSVSS